MRTSVKMDLLTILFVLLHFFEAANTQSTNVTVRLVNGTRPSQGRVEIFYNDTWGTICDDSWSTNNARVICHMLGYVSDPVMGTGNAAFGAGLGPIWLDDVSCRGTEPSVVQCRHPNWGVNNCQHTEDAGVDCNLTALAVLPVRLAGGNSSREGRVEIHYNGQWGTVCDDGWNVADATVVCRQLGFANSDVMPLPNAVFGAGSGSIWMDDVNCGGNETGLGICTAKKWGNSDCGHNEDAGVICSTPGTQTALQARLSSGTSQYTGRVEIQHHGFWGTVCDDGFDGQEAQVVCRMLGFSGGIVSRVPSAGPAQSPIWLDDLGCLGNETSLADCVHKPWGVTNCQHSEDAAVTCQPVQATTLQVRLAGGPNSNEGRVELLYHGQWGTICDDLWDSSDADVVCRMLHLSTAGAIAVKNAYPGGTGPIHMDDVRCVGTETTLADCQFPGFGHNNCEHNEDAGVKCHASGITANNITARLIGGTSFAGRVEIFYKGAWGTICDDNFGTLDAMVVCRMLGYPAVGAHAYPQARYGAGTGQILLDDLNCRGTETNIDLCGHRAWGSSNCHHNEDASVSCAGGPTVAPISVRLVGGTTRNEGRVEVQHAGQWGTVCDDGWDTKDAEVTCRMLGMSWRGAQPRSQAFYGQGTLPILLDDVKCNGTETSLDACRHRTWSQSDCQHAEDAGVICQNSPFVRVRLRGGPDTSQGRVEMFYNRTWGTICSDGFGPKEARVVCRMVGYRVPGSTVFPNAFYGQGQGPVFLDDVKCLGSEANILYCSNKGLGVAKAQCSHRRDVGVQCNPAAIHARLQNGTATSGRLELLVGGQWGTVCDDSFTNMAAAVACRMLGLLPVGATAVPSQTGFGPGTGRIVLDDVICVGNETSLLDCRHSALLVQNCQHNEDIGVLCGTGPAPSSTRVRLVGGTNDNEGRVEIFLNGSWGTVCDDSFTDKAAMVVCRWLNINVANAIVVNQAGLGGQGTGQIVLDDVVCQGTEATLLQCRHTAVGQSDCRHNEDVGVRCLTAAALNQQFRLVNGSNSRSGRVEILYNGQWGTVCDDEWGVQEAKVVCRKLGFPTNYAVPITNAFFGQGAGSIVLDDIVCNGSEPSITYCQHKAFGNNDCQHSEDAGVLCLPRPVLSPVLVRLRGGLTVSQGRVEVLYSGYWGTICNDNFGTQEANVICRMLGFSRGGRALSQNAVGTGTGPIWLDDLNCVGTEGNIADCPRKGGWGDVDCGNGHDEDAGVLCLTDVTYNFTARLVNGPSNMEGRVEILYQNQWSTICDDNWGNTDAAVVCSMLGFSTDDATAISQATYGPGNGTILLDEVGCVGTEINLAQCPNDGLGHNDCQHNEDAGVRCNPRTHVDTAVRVRLVNGHDSNSGRVEVFHNNVWGTICDDNWGLPDAQVVCRMLGKSTIGVLAKGRAFFGQGRGPILLDEVNCHGTESSISQCRHSGWANQNCQHVEDAGVICGGLQAAYPLRLVGRSRNEGRLEVFYQGSWGTVCDDNFGTEEAMVVCYALGFSTAGAVARPQAYYGAGTGTIFLDDVVCQGTEHTINHCRHGSWGHSNCNHNEDVGVVCPAGAQNMTSVRLAGSSSPNQGRVEVYFNGTWGTVCDDLFDANEAGVICTMLGFDRAGSIPKNGAFFGQGSGRIFLDDLNCRGTETNIFQCAAKPPGQHNCGHGEDAGVICHSGSLTQIRLVGGRTRFEGRVEINYNNTWGTVCDDGFDTHDAQTVCRMLGFPTAGVTAYQQAHFGRGSGPIWLDDLSCTGTETTLLQCGKAPIGHSNCNHNEDAGVLCSNQRMTTHRITRPPVTPVPTPNPSTVFVRLMNGPTAHEGRVEIWNSGEFGTVCDHNWSANDANVICAMLGYSRSGAQALTGAAYGQGTGRIWLDNVRCGGFETNIVRCPSNGWQTHGCGHHQDAGVKCFTGVRPNNFILAGSYSHTIIRMDLSTYSYVTVPHDSHSNPITLDYDPVDVKIYWSDTGNDQIGSSNLDGTNRKILVQLNSHSNAEGIAVDPISRNVYYTDTGNNIIAVMTLDGLTHKTLINSGLQNPRAIVTQPKLGLLFWTDWGRIPKIEGSNLDGSSRHTVISTGIRYPTGLTIDIPANRLYWCDSGTRKIETSDFNGNSRRTILGGSTLNSLYGIAVSSTYVYYTQSYSIHLMRINKSNGHGKQTVGPGLLGRLRGIALYRNGYGITGTNACSMGRGGCAYICFPTPGGGKTCGCPDGLTLQLGGVSCSKDVPCPPLQAPTMGALDPSNCTTAQSTIGSVCTLTCNNGFTLIGQAMITCLSNGQWSNYGTPLRCSDTQPPQIACPQAISVTAQSSATSAVVTWNTPTATDNAGGNVRITQSMQSPSTLNEGKYTVFVTATDTTGHASSCTFSVTVIVKRCPQLTLPDNAYLTGSSCPNYYGSSCPVQCRDGYKLSGQASQAQVICNVGNGGSPMWSTSGITCTAVTCSALRTPSNGAISGCTDPFKVGAVCSQRCKTGFIQRGGTLSRQCTQDGRWSGQNIFCSTTVTCPPLSTPNNGALSCAAPFTVGSLCTQSCLSGFVPNSVNPIRQCLPDSTWSGQVIGCGKPVTCPALANAGNGKVFGCAAPFTVGAICSQSCNAGFLPTGGTNTRQCMQDGTWGGDTIGCAKPPTCALPSSPNNGQLNNCQTTSSVRTVCMQSCNDGYQQTGGTPLRQCNSDGSWTGKTLMCTKGNSTGPNSSAQTGNGTPNGEAPADNTAALVVLAVLVSILIVAGVVAGLFFYKRRWRTGNNTSINNSGRRSFEIGRGEGVSNPGYEQ